MMNQHARQTENTELRFFYEAPLVVLAGAVLVEAFMPGASARFAGWPFVISLVLVGMPHGAVDFSLNNHLRKSSTTRGKLLSFTGYVLMLFASLSLFLVSPSAVLVLFLLLSATHFGLADARGLEFRFKERSAAWIRKLSAATRGALILILPFLFWPDESLSVFSNIVAIAGQVPPTVSSPHVVILAAAVVSLAAFSHTLVTTGRLLAGHTRTAGVEALETSMICLAIFTLHPLFAMGLYVLAWHSWRHMFSLMRLQPFAPAGPTSLEFMAAVTRIHVRSLPLLLPTLGIFAAVAWWRLDDWSIDILAALTIAFFAVVTLPHHLLIERFFAQASASRSSRDDEVAESASAVGLNAGNNRSLLVPANTL